MRRVAVGLVVLAWAGQARAQVAAPAPERLAVGDWTLAPVAEARVRGEYRHDLDGEDTGTLTERVRLGVDAERGPVEVRVVLQDARLWALGDGASSIGQPAPLAATGAYEGWIGAHTSGAAPSFVRIGRQAVTWGEGRLLGASDWSATGRSLDAARGRWVVSDWAFELLVASLSDPGVAGVAGVGPAWGELAGARAEWALDPLLAFELYGLARFAQAQPVNDLEGSVEGQTYTAALRLHGDALGWAWGAEGAGQLGRATALVADRRAWAAAGHVAYTFDRVLLRPTVGVGGSYATGDSGGSTYGAFDPLLPDAHTWYGAMDLFAWSNEAEASARVAVTPWTDGLAAIEYRYARLAQPGGSWRSDNLVTIAGPSIGRDADLGHEIDASLRWRPWEPVELSAGYSALLVGAGAKEALSAFRSVPDVAHFAFGQVSVRTP